MIIIGAGMAGCLAGIHNPNARILEAAANPQIGHQALLRFRSSAIMELTGIQMEQKIVHKAIWDGGFAPVNPRLANLYSLKTTGKILSRSIWDLEPVERFIPPPDFYSQLLDLCEDRIEWGEAVVNISGDHIYTLHTAGSHLPSRREGAPIISTMPLSKMAKATGLPAPDSEMESSMIHISKFKIQGEGYQTIYFPSIFTPVYRASLSGDMLIVESMGTEINLASSGVLDAFGLIYDKATEHIGDYTHILGKIIPIDNLARREFLRRATVEFGVYSLGRFATWRSVLLDDCMKDLAVIRRMIHSDHYELTRREHQDED